MAVTRSGIPTTYRHTDFRSRLEARWAAFFDLVGWSWVYEPIDAEGYIPDFLVKGTLPLYVEVGPCVTRSDFCEKTDKADLSADVLRHDLLVVGVDPGTTWLGEFWRYDCGGSGCGYQVGDDCRCGKPGSFAWGEGAWSTCVEDSATNSTLWRLGRLTRDAAGRWPVTGCGQLGVAHTVQSFHLRPCGHYPGGHIHEPRVDLERLWSEAGNTVKWHR
jgi:hypothetical protein